LLLIGFVRAVDDGVVKPSSGDHAVLAEGSFDVRRRDTVKPSNW